MFKGIIETYMGDVRRLDRLERGGKETDIAGWYEGFDNAILTAIREKIKKALLTDEEIKDRLTRIEPEGFNWGDITKGGMIKFKAVAQAMKGNILKEFEAGK